MALSSAPSTRPAEGSSNGRYRLVTLLALVALSVIIVSGAAVRLTGSGLGCTDWPTCTEDQLHAPLEYHAMIEFLNRLFTGVVSVSVMLAVLGSFRVRPRRRDLTWWSLGLVAGVLGQIVLGGMVVLFHLNPWLVLNHFLLSMVLVWNAVVLHHRAGTEPGPRRPRMGADAVRLSRLMVGAALLTIVTGTLVTGSGPHSGSHDGDPIERLPFSVFEIVRFHGASMVLFLLVTLALGWRLRDRPDAPADPDLAAARRDLVVVLVVLVAQAAIGYTQYFTGVPVLLVGIHIAGATAVWIAVLRFHLRRFTPVHAEAPAMVAKTPVTADT